MSHLRVVRCLTICLAVFLLSRVVPAEPVRSYELIPIADSSGPLGTPLFGAINNRGTVAIRSRLDTGEQIIFLWDRGENRQVASFGAFAFPSNPDLNDRGEVSFMFRETGGESVFLKIRNGEIVERVEEGDRFDLLLCCPLINNRGDMTVFGLLDGIEGIYTVNRGKITTIADSTGPFSYFGPATSINERGQVAFTADPDDPDRAAVLVGDGRRTDVIVDASGPFEFFTSGVINDSGTAAAQAFPDGLIPSPSILVRDRQGLRVFVGPDGPFEFPDRPLLNNAGLLVFTSTLDGSFDRGVYTGPDPGAGKVLAPGDPLAGSTVVGTAATGLNNAGVIVLYVELADGRKGLWLAVPHPATR